MSIEYLNKLYIKYPIFLESYYFQDGDLVLNIINQNNENIEKVEIQFNNQIFEQEVYSTKRIQKVVFSDIEKNNLHSKPIFLSTTIDGKKYVLNDYSDYIIMNKPKSIFNLGLERYLYKNNIAKVTKLNKRDINYIAQDGEYFWHCTCGTTNLSGFDECVNCGNKKNELLSVPTSYEYEGMRTEKIVKIKVNILIWLFVIFFAHILIQIVNGDFLFDNLAKNNFFGVFNRFIVPLMLFLTTLGELLASRVHSKKSSFIFSFTNLSFLLYLNAVSAFAFVLTAYNLLFLIGIDILFVIMLIYRHYNLKNKIHHHIVLGLIVVLFLIIGTQWNKYSKFDLIVEPKGINLNVSTEEEIYYIPEKINNVKIYKVVFNSTKEYNIKELYIGENIESISMFSTAVLPKLEKINVDPNNEEFYVKNGLLYSSDDLIKLAPMMTKEIVLNDKYIPDFAFTNNYYLEKLTIGNKVEHIGTQAFENNYNLKEIVFSENSSINYIEANAFKNCSSLLSIDFPISLEKMGVGVLEGCDNLVELRAPFIGAKRENYSTNTESTDIFNYFFGSRSYLLNELIPTTLRKVEIYDILRIHNVTFYRALNVEEIILPDNMIFDIGTRSFFRCESLKEFTIPNGIVTIKESAFEQTKALKTIIIPASVVTIEKNAFLESGLESAIYLGDINNLKIDSEGNNILIDLLS